MKNNEQQDEKLHITKSVFETSKDMQEKADEEARLRREELERQREQKRKKAEGISSGKELTGPARKYKKWLVRPVSISTAPAAQGPSW